MCPCPSEQFWRPQSMKGGPCPSEQFWRPESMKDVRTGLRVPRTFGWRRATLAAHFGAATRVRVSTECRQFAQLQKGSPAPLMPRVPRCRACVPNSPPRPPNPPLFFSHRTVGSLCGTLLVGHQADDAPGVLKTLGSQGGRMMPCLPLWKHGGVPEVWLGPPP